MKNINLLLKGIGIFVLVFMLSFGVLYSFSNTAFMKGFQRGFDCANNMTCSYRWVNHHPGDGEEVNIALNDTPFFNASLILSS